MVDISSKTFKRGVGNLENLKFFSKQPECPTQITLVLKPGFFPLQPYAKTISVPLRARQDPFGPRERAARVRLGAVRPCRTYYHRSSRRRSPVRRRKTLGHAIRYRQHVFHVQYAGRTRFRRLLPFPWSGARGTGRFGQKRFSPPNRLLPSKLISIVHGID